MTCLGVEYYKNGKKLQTGTLSLTFDAPTLPITSSLGLSNLEWKSTSLHPEDASSASALAMAHVPAGRLRTCVQCAQAQTTLGTNAQTRCLRRNPDQLPCGGVSVYIKKGLYHHQVQMDSHLQAVTVQVTMGDTPVTILSVHIPSSNHITSRDLSYLTRNIRGQILTTGHFNGHSYLWGSHDVNNHS